MKWFKIFMVGTALALTPVAFTACDDGDAEEVGEEIDEAAENVEDAVEDTVD
jgi:hypothetical protein